MTKLATVVIPHAFTTKWIQILITSLKSFKCDNEFNIWVINNSPPGNRSLEGITETGLSEGVQIIENKFMRSHTGALDYALSVIDTPYLFATETDCRALKPNWIDRFFSEMKDDYVAMAGWYWPGSDREYISPGACLYNTAILKTLKEEIHRNNSNIICYGRDLKKRFDLSKHNHWNEYIVSKFHGPFSEVRGFQEIWSFRDDKWYQEPGAWVFYRCQIEYECVRMPGVLFYVENPHVADGTWYMDKELLTVDRKEAEKNSYYVHYWGGTVSHNWEHTRILEPWQQDVLPWWIDHEDKLWREVVSGDVRKKTLELGLVKTGDEEKEYILNHPNVRPGRSN